MILSVETVTAITPVSSRLRAAMISAPLADFSIRIVCAARGQRSSTQAWASRIACLVAFRLACRR